MSSIIKGERIRNQSVVNLSERFKAIHIEYEKDETEDEVLDSANTLHTHIEGETSQEEEALLLTDVHKQQEEILQEAQKMAHTIVEEAKQRAEEILSAALTKADELKEETRIKQTQILCEAKAKSEEILQEAAAEAMHIRKQAQQEKEELIMTSEGEVVAVLQKLLSHIISEELFQNTQWLKCMVHKMLQECHTKEEIKVCISPQLFGRLTESEKEEIQCLGDKVSLEVRNTLNDTTCEIETKEGNISYNVVEGLERVISEIKTLEKLS